MKNNSIFLTMAIAFALNVLFVFSLSGQDVGIGTASPDYRLHVCGPNSSLLKIDNTTTLNPDIKAELFFKTGQFYTGGIKTIGTSNNLARLGLFTWAAGNAGSLYERMSILDDGKVGIGTTTPNFLLDVNGRMRIRNGGGTAGMYFMNAANTTNNAFVGMYNDEYVGIYGGNGAGWNFLINTTNGKIGIGTTSPSAMLEVYNDEGTASYFNNTSGNYLSYGVTAYSVASPGNGFGVRGEGGNTGVWGVGNGDGAGDRTGVSGYGTNGSGTNYGVEGYATYGNVAIGIYGNAAYASTNWAGWFSGSVYSSGTYQGSDRKLKSNIQPMSDAIKIIEKLKPSSYDYKTTEYEQLHLSEGHQYGLIADEVKLVLPDLVKKAIQPARYEIEEGPNGRMISAEVEFEAVNYTAMIPILIGAIQEQQVMIEELQKKLELMENKIR